MSSSTLEEEAEPAGSPPFSPPPPPPRLPLQPRGLGGTVPVRAGSVRVRSPGGSRGWPLGTALPVRGKKIPTKLRGCYYYFGLVRVFWSWGRSLLGGPAASPGAGERREGGSEPSLAGTPLLPGRTVALLGDTQQRDPALSRRIWGKSAPREPHIFPRDRSGPGEAAGGPCCPCGL